MHVLRVLGTVDVADGGGGWRRAGPAKQSCVLAALALSPGVPLSVAELTARVWGTDAPVSAPNVLYGHMTRLRALLRKCGDETVALARSRDGGYRLDLEPGRIDLFTMRAMASRAQHRLDDGDHAGAVDLWRAACDAWRGPALLGLDSDWAQRTRLALGREHVSVLVGRFETELALGNHAAIVSDLYQAVGRDPTAEPLVGHLMVALYRCDRAAEALACFDEARARLRDHLGTEPAPRLQELHRQILRHDPALTPPIPTGTVDPADQPPAGAAPLDRAAASVPADHQRNGPVSSGPVGDVVTTGQTPADRAQAGLAPPVASDVGGPADRPPTQPASPGRDDPAVSAKPHPAETAPSGPASSGRAGTGDPADRLPGETGASGQVGAEAAAAWPRVVPGESDQSRSDVQAGSGIPADQPRGGPAPLGRAEFVDRAHRPPACPASSDRAGVDVWVDQPRDGLGSTALPEAEAVDHASGGRVDGVGADEHAVAGSGVDVAGERSAVGTGQGGAVGPDGRSVGGGVPLMQLPGATAAFVGRGVAVAQLVGHARRACDARTSGVVAVAAVDGMAGVGKTALAVHVAHELAGEFPDGQLFVDLHGFTADVAPVTPADALARMLRALGVPAEQIPDDVEDRAAAYRGALAGKRVLVVLDNAADEQQVRPLLPGHRGAFVLVTSRHRLPGLDDARPVSLDVLDGDAAVALFGRVAGRVLSHERERVSRVVALCGRLPLAIRIAAARFRNRPYWTVADLLDRLSAERRPLAELAVRERSVSAAFQTSYRELDAVHRRAFRLLSLAPGPDFGVHAAAALLDTSVTGAERRVEALLDAHLLRASASGRYRFHDLLRRYASGVSQAEDTTADRKTALTRLLDVYRHASNVAGGLIAPHLEPPRAPPQSPALEFPDRAAAVSWFDTERAHLTDAVKLAVGEGLDTHAWQIAMGLCAYLDRDGSFGDIVPVAESGVSAARAAGAERAEAILLKQLGSASRMLNRFPEAGDVYREALRILRDGADRRGEAMVLNSLGLLRQYQGRFTDSIECFQDALRLVDTDDTLAAMILTNLGVPLNPLRRTPEALGHYRAAVEIYRKSSHEGGVATATGNIGGALWQLGEYDAALEHHLRAKGYFERTRVPHLLAVVHNALGCDLRSLGRLDEAADNHRKALLAFRRLRDRHNEGDALVELGRTLLAADRPDSARQCFTEAIEVTATIESPYQEARAHHGIADCPTRHGDLGDVRAHLEKAIAGFAACGVPDADELRARLAGD